MPVKVECSCAKALCYIGIAWWVCVALEGAGWTLWLQHTDGSFWEHLHEITLGCLLIVLAVLGTFCEVYFRTDLLSYRRVACAAQLTFAIVYFCIGGLLSEPERSVSGDDETARNWIHVLGVALCIWSWCLVVCRLVLLVRVPWLPKAPREVDAALNISHPSGYSLSPFGDATPIASAHPSFVEPTEEQRWNDFASSSVASSVNPSETAGNKKSAPAAQASKSALPDAKLAGTDLDVPMWDGT
jgi:hypothetical protein